MVTWAIKKIQIQSQIKDIYLKVDKKMPNLSLGSKMDLKLSYSMKIITNYELNRSREFK